MTLYPAERLTLPAKGRIAIGADADLTVFDPKTILDCASTIIYISSRKGLIMCSSAAAWALDHKQVACDRLGNFIPSLSQCWRAVLRECTIK